MKSKVPSWFRSRGYLHFDLPIGLSKATKIVSDPQAVARHAFYPLIAYEIESEKLKRDKKSGRLSLVKKRRPIAYAAHLDSHIFSYYATNLGKAYEDAIQAAGIDRSILAFRPLGLSNIHFAAEAFQEIRSRGSCAVVALDITGFFDNLDHRLLKRAWSRVLGRDPLPDDHYALYRAITRFSIVDRSRLYREFDISEHNPKASGRRICLPEEFRTRVRLGGLIETNAKQIGIPQGTPVSALLSNIYMFDFDCEIAELVEQCGGRYLRYCDDMLVIVPTSEYRHIAGDVRARIKQLGLDINPDKTEISIFTQRGGVQRCDRPLQYLGFTYDGKQALIRSAALARYSQRMKAGIKLARATAKSNNKLRSTHGRTTKELFRRKLYERYSHLGKRNFVKYGLRAADILGSPGIRKQLKPLWKRLIAEIKA